MLLFNKFSMFNTSEFLLNIVNVSRNIESIGLCTFAYEVKTFCLIYKDSH